MPSDNSRVGDVKYLWYSRGSGIKNHDKKKSIAKSGNLRKVAENGNLTDIAKNGNLRKVAENGNLTDIAKNGNFAVFALKSFSIVYVERLISNVRNKTYK